MFRGFLEKFAKDFPTDKIKNGRIDSYRLTQFFNGYLTEKNYKETSVIRTKAFGLINKIFKERDRLLDKNIVHRVTGYLKRVKNTGIIYYSTDASTFRKS